MAWNKWIEGNLEAFMKQEGTPDMPDLEEFTKKYGTLFILERKNGELLLFRLLTSKDLREIKSKIGNVESKKENAAGTNQEGEADYRLTYVPEELQKMVAGESTETTSRTPFDRSTDEELQEAISKEVIAKTMLWPGIKDTFLSDEELFEFADEIARKSSLSSINQVVFEKWNPISGKNVEQDVVDEIDLITRERNYFLIGFFLLIGINLFYRLVMISYFPESPAGLVRLAQIGTLFSKGFFLYLVYRLSKAIENSGWLTFVYCVFSLFSVLYLVPFIGLLVGVRRKKRSLKGNRVKELEKE